MTFLPTGQISPGAVPRVWTMIDAPFGTSPCRALFAAISRPRALNIARIRPTMSSWRSSSTFITVAIASRVMSSWVGPRPPQQMTASLRERAIRNASTMRW